MEGQSCVLRPESVFCTPHKAASTMYISLVALLGAQSSCIIKRPRAYFLREPAGGRTQMLPGLRATGAWIAADPGKPLRT